MPGRSRTPRSARFVAWSNAVLAGRVSPDLAAERIVADDPPHRVDGLPEDGVQTLPVFLARLGHTSVAPPASVPGSTAEPALRLVLPVPGDPAGLPGPGMLTTAALDVGEAVLLPPRSEGCYGLIPTVGVDPPSVVWTAYEVPAAPATPQPTALPSLAEADRDLAVALREATEMLAELDLARWDSSLAEDVDALRQGRLDGDGLAPGYPNRAHEVLARARRLRAIVELAGRDDGAAVTASEAHARRSALFPLDRAARYAEMAAHNALLEPGATLRS